MRPVLPGHPFLKSVLPVITLVILFWIGSFFPDLVLALIISALAAFILSPFVSAFENRFGMRRAPAIITTFVTVGGALVYILSILLPTAFDRMVSIQEQIRQFPFASKLLEVTKGVEATLPFIDGASLAKSIEQLIERTADGVGNSIQRSLGTLITLAIVPFVTYFILADGPRTFASLIERVPNKYFEMTLNVVQKIRRQLVRYLKGWLLDSMIVGILSMIGLWACSTPSSSASSPA
jgi:putative permease